MNETKQDINRSQSFILVILQFFLVNKVGKIHFVLNQTKIKSKEWLHLSIPVMFGALLFYLILQLNLIMVEMLSPSENSVGYYAAVSKIASLLFVFSNLVRTIFVSQKMGLKIFA